MSIFDRADLVPPAPTWRCSHCRTLQPEAAHCRACARAAVTCSTCHRFRRSVAADLGYCATDGARAPLRGDEVRACWERASGVMGVPGLFDDVGLLPAPRDEMPAPPPSSSRTSAADDELPGATTGPLAASGRLVDAPHVAPGRVLMSESERRSQGDQGRGTG